MAFRYIPHQRFGGIIDVRAQRVEGLVHRAGPRCFGAVECLIAAGEAIGLAAVDLPAIAAAFVDHQRADTGLDQRLCRADARWSGPDD